MTDQRDLYQHQLQMDYFSDDYLRFEADFYRYSALNTPLTFLIDDILLAMAKAQKAYFKLNKENAKDCRDHYFLFDIEGHTDNKLVRRYKYLQTMTSIPK